MTTTDKTLLATATILALLMGGVTAAEAAPKKVAKAPAAAAAAAAEPAPAAPGVLPPKEEAKPAAKETAAKEDESESADEVAPTGFTLSARAGYALPLGSIAKDASLNGATDLSKTAAGMAPLWVDMGYRFGDSKWYIGGYFQFGIISTAGDYCKRVAGAGNACTSSGTNIRFGAIAKYTFKPNAKITPWVGLSSGYEMANISVTVGNNSGDNSVKGWEFIGLHVGADFHVSPAVSIGPALMASFGQYSSISWSNNTESGSSDFTNTALHQWVFLGANGRFDL